MLKYILTCETKLKQSECVNIICQSLSIHHPQLNTLKVQCEEFERIYWGWELGMHDIRFYEEIRYAAIQLISLVTDADVNISTFFPT